MALLGKIIGAIRSVAKSIFSPKGRIFPRSKGAIRAPRMIEYKGTKKSLTEWSKDLGISEATLRWRIKKYGTLEKPDVDNRIVAYSDAKVIKGENGIEIEIDGVRKPLPEVAKELGINYHTLANRIWKGKSIDEILAKVKISNRDYEKNPVAQAKLWEWNGAKHTVKEWAKIYGIKPAMMRKRLKEHGSPERNCERLEAYKANRAKRFEWNGESHTIAEWGKITGKSESAVRSSLKKYGSPYAPPRQKKAKAVLQEQCDTAYQESMPPDDGELYGFCGKWKRISEWAEEYGIERESCERNFTLYGEPTKPLDAEGEEEEEVGLVGIDAMLRANAQDTEPKQSIKEWLEEVGNAPDDGTPLKETLGIPEHYHTLDKVVPRFHE